MVLVPKNSRAPAKNLRFAAEKLWEPVKGLKKALFEAERQRKAYRGNKKGLVCAGMGKNIVFRKRGRAFVPEPGKFYAGERSNSETSTIKRFCGRSVGANCRIKKLELGIFRRRSADRRED